MTARRTFALPLLAAFAALTLAACSTGDADPGATGASSAPPASSSATPSASPSPTEEAWQEVALEDGATWRMPADWTTVDESSENETGSVLSVRVLDASGTQVLDYWHDHGALGGLGTACTESPALTVLAQQPSQSGLVPVRDGAMVDAAYAVEQPDGRWILTIGTIEGEQLAMATTCMLYNAGVAPDGMMASFATSFSSGLPGEGTEPLEWTFFPSSDAAQQYVDSEAGQTLLEVVESLRLAG